MGRQILSLAILFWCVVTAAAAAVELLPDVLSGCKPECGDISVPYPFGLDKPGCFKDSTFELTCNESTNPPTLLLFNIPVLSISVEEGTFIVQLHMYAYRCNNETGSSQKVDLANTPFTFSNTSNKFTAIGCNVIAFVSDSDGTDGFTTGCLSMCSNDTLNNTTQEVTSCSGIGCCQTPIPNNLNTLYVTLKPVSNRWDPNHCIFGFLADTTWFENSSNFSLADTPETVENPHVLLDWAIRDNSCGGDPNDIICGPHTNCIDSTNGPGYRCVCDKGYQGNPYMLKGCTDIDECLPTYGNKYPCKGTCKNTEGNYNCLCSFGHEGDGKVGCRLKTVSKFFMGNPF